MKAPQIILIVVWALSLGLTMARHGEPRGDSHNGWLSLAAILLTAAILWWGGFWS